MVTRDGSDETVPEAVSEAGGTPTYSLRAAPGATFGRFMVTGTLGRGGMGEVMAAFDPELDRMVAIKVLHGATGAVAVARARLQREAKAMARLAHPNTVTVYEVGHFGEQMFIAMELVDGTTLRAWLAERPRPWREILAAYVAAGRGLEAAHAAGLVHRDFKPDNVLIGRDGRPRVGDFGLAHSGQRAGADGNELESGFSVDGAVVGTPAYMAPEQWRGGDADARSDQFAFCVALWRALHGRAPFEGTNVAELEAAVLAGRRTPRGERTEVPGWMAAVLDRGLSIDRAQRWPSMGALLDELERRARARRMRWIGAGVAVVAAAAAGAIAVAVMQPARIAQCAPPTGRTDAVWSAARRDQLARHLAATDPAGGAGRFAAAAAVLDRGIAEWTAAHVDTCRANLVEGRRPPDQHEAQMSCLDGWLDDAGDAIAALERSSDPRGVEQAVQGVAALPALDHCGDVAQLMKARTMPEAPAARAEAQAILDELNAIEAVASEGPPPSKALVDRSLAAVARARALGHPRILSGALGTTWRVQERAGDHLGAIATMREEVDAASRDSDDREAALAWARMGSITGADLQQPDEARVMFAAARAALARAGDPPLLRADLLRGESEVLSMAGDLDAARAALDEARRLYVDAGADQPGSPYTDELGHVFMLLGTVESMAGRFEEATAARQRAISLVDRALGPGNRSVASIQMDMAFDLERQDRFGEADALMTAAIATLERIGVPTYLASALSLRAQLLEEMGQFDAAIALSERAIELTRDAGPDYYQRVQYQAVLASHYTSAGRLDEAVARYDAVIADLERLGIETLNAASYWAERADLHRRLGHWQAGLADYARAREIATAVDGDADLFAILLRGEAACLHGLGRDDEAIEHLERALKIPTMERGSIEIDVALARGLLGMLLTERRRDRAKGTTLVQEAVARLHALDASDPRVAVLEAWLGRRR
jgi:tetratricopeptide (TPR) repeat protein